MVVPIVSDKRPIIEVEVNKHNYYFLVDTGASVGMVNLGDTEKMGFTIGEKLLVTAMGASGKQLDLYHVKNMDANIMGVKMHQFVAANIQDIVNNIKKATGFTISGIIGTIQIKQTEMQINLQDKEIKLGY